MVLQETRLNLACFGLFRDCANHDARLVHSLCERTIGSKIIMVAPEELLGDVGHVKSRFSPSRDSAKLDAR
jgi:hypothetical protein